MNERNKDYVFLSYSHQDNIAPLIAQFDEKGYNIVYDASMIYGEEWELNARRYITSDKCKGVILFVSETFFKSKPIMREVELASIRHKKIMVIVANNQKLEELYKRIKEIYNEDEYYIATQIQEQLSLDKIYVEESNIDWKRMEDALGQWGFKPDESKRAFQYVDVKYTSEIDGEKVRLKQQQMGYYDFDMSAISSVIDGFTRDDLCVLDLGCADGQLTVSRFKDSPKIKTVIGIDYNEKDVVAANNYVKEQGLDGKFKFYVADLESSEVIDNLQNILNENGCEKVDVVFSALVLHHLEKPKMLLLKLYEIFSDDGKIILRGSDDGGKLCHPGNELLQEILTRYGKVVKNSDRENGRKLYNWLYNAGYVDIKVNYRTTDTCEKDRKSKDNLFKVGFEFRLKRMEDLIKANPDSIFLKNEYEWLKDSLEKLREMFCERDFWYCVTAYIAIAGVR